MLESSPENCWSYELKKHQCLMKIVGQIHLSCPIVHGEIQ